MNRQTPTPIWDERSRSNQICAVWNTSGAPLRRYAVEAKLLARPPAFPKLPKVGTKVVYRLGLYTGDRPGVTWWNGGPIDQVTARWLEVVVPVPRTPSVDARPAPWLARAGT